MSNIYIQEPPTEGKVLLETTVGDIDIELWSRECPKACRNFIQLCMEGYYDRTVFFRLVKGFIVQGGDPSGTGTGGNSIWGKPFKDELHSRLRFVRRGLVAMANAGRDDNGSQFFFTLGQTPELQNKHTIFGKVGGKTIYNMLKLEEGDTDQNERPLYPHKILRTKILNNPFDDIVPRQAIKPLSKSEKKSSVSATKNFTLLSFGEEAEEEEEEIKTLNKQLGGKGKSSHDLTNDPKLSSIPALDKSKPPEIKEKKVEEDPDELAESERVDDEESAASLLVSVQEKLKGSTSNKKESSKKRKNEPAPAEEDDDVEEYYLGKSEKLADQQRIESIRKEFKQLKRTMKEEQGASKRMKEEDSKDSKLKEESEVLKSYFDEQKVYKEKKSAGKKGDDREAQTLALLAKFKSKISTAIEENPDTVSTPSAAEKPELGKLYEGDNFSDDPNDLSWLAKSLHNEVDEAVLAKDANKKSDDWYEIYDPKNPLNRRRREESKRAEGERWKKSKPLL